MFAHPRTKKTLLPPFKKRKITHGVEEINFDNQARADYLTGFHKRKLQRVRHAQEEAAKKARQEKISLRRQLREERKQAVEDHVRNVNTILEEAERAGQDHDQESAEAEQDEWAGIHDASPEDQVDHEEEYIDENRYTTVAIESVTVSKDGLAKATDCNLSDGEGQPHANEPEQGKHLGKSQRVQSSTSRKKQKFRYETKAERQLGRNRQGSRRRKRLK